MVAPGLVGLGLSSPSGHLPSGPGTPSGISRDFEKTLVVFVGLWVLESFHPFVPEILNRKPSTLNPVLSETPHMCGRDSESQHMGSSLNQGPIYSFNTQRAQHP